MIKVSKSRIFNSPEGPATSGDAQWGCLNLSRRKGQWPRRLNSLTRYKIDARGENFRPTTGRGREGRGKVEVGVISGERKQRTKTGDVASGRTRIEDSL